MAIVEGLGPVTAPHQARHQARRFVESVARVRLDPSLMEFDAALIRSLTNDAGPKAHTQSKKMEVLLDNAPLDPGLIYGVRAAAVSLLAPMHLAIHVCSRVQVAAADILWNDDAAEVTWSRLLN